MGVRTLRWAVLAGAAALALAAPAAAQLPPLLGGGQGTPEAPSGPRYANPVLPGDYPDPSVARDGRDYWMVATSGGWHPPFTMLASRDLVNWAVAGSVLRRAPAWTQGDFWAPEIVKRANGFLVYYAVHNRRRQFCIGVAEAARPTQFFRDRGPVVCSDVGAIDPLPVLDEADRPYLVWKEDGNSRGEPTPIVAAPLTEDGLRLAGPTRELFRNDQPWEGSVIEGPALGRRDGKLYAFYSARTCCGPWCDYVTGVARAPALLGPWEKRSAPILSGSARFRCPGHSTLVDGPEGDQYLLYEAYAVSSAGSLGRQVLLDRVDWGPDGWPNVADGTPSVRAPAPLGAAQVPPAPFRDEFRGRFLTAGWSWMLDRPLMKLDRRRGGRLWMSPARHRRDGVLGRQPGMTSWVAETAVGERRRGASAGIAAFRDPGHAVGIAMRGSRAVAWVRNDGAPVTLGVLRLARARAVPLRLTLDSDGQYIFEARGRAGWVRVAGPYPAAWLVETRVVLRVAGARGARAAFERFSLAPRG